jgi:ribonuclease Z
MSFDVGSPWEYDGYRFYGLSLAGIRTAIAMPEFSLCFDTAQGYPYVLNLNNFFVTHGHLDHAAGIPYIISQKMMTSQKTPKFYMPESLVQPLTDIMNLWSKIEGFTYRFEFIGVKADQEIEINNHHYIKVFPTVHRIDSFGYTLFNKRKKLKSELSHLSKNEITLRSQKGEQVSEIVHTPVVSFTGDTQIEFLNLRPWVRKSKILIMEATYLDSQRTVARAREWGHTHLDEIIPILDQIESEKIVLIHSSSRYSPNEIQKYIEEKVPALFRSRVLAFPGR